MTIEMPYSAFILGGAGLLICLLASYCLIKAKVSRPYILKRVDEESGLTFKKEVIGIMIISGVIAVIFGIIPLLFHYLGG